MTARLQAVSFVATLLCAAHGYGGERSDVTAVNVTPGLVELLLSAPAEFRYAYLRGNAERRQPDRCYVDLSPASLDRHLRPFFDIAIGPIQRVRMAQFRDNTVRVVLDLRSSYECRMFAFTEPDRLIIIVSVDPNVQQSVLTGERTTKVKRRPTASLQLSSELTIERIAVGKRATFSDIQGQVSEPLWTFTHGVQSITMDETPPNFVIPSAIPLAQQEKDPSREGPLDLPGRAQESFLHLANIVFFQQLSLTWQHFSLAFRPLPPMPFLPAWSLAYMCRERGCSSITTNSRSMTNGPNIVTLHESAENLDREFSFVKQEREMFVTGGVTMYEMWIWVITVGSLVSFFAGAGLVWLLTNRKRNIRGKQSRNWETRMAILEEAVNRAGVVNSSFFHSLELSQKRMKSLLTQADIAEQNLRRLLHQASVGGEKPIARTDAYATAAFLLAEGEGVQQVARALKLPLAQVRLLQELQHQEQREKTAVPPEKVAEPLNGGFTASLVDPPIERRNGAGHDGIYFASNGQQL